jgi:hypothetical protein
MHPFIPPELAGVEAQELHHQARCAARVSRKPAAGRGRVRPADALAALLAGMAASFVHGS